MTSGGGPMNPDEVARAVTRLIPSVDYDEDTIAVMGSLNGMLPDELIRIRSALDSRDQEIAKLQTDLNSADESARGVHDDLVDESGSRLLLEQHYCTLVRSVATAVSMITTEDVKVGAVRKALSEEGIFLAKYFVRSTTERERERR